MEYLIWTTVVAIINSTVATQAIARAINTSFLPDTLLPRPVQANAMPPTTNMAMMSNMVTCQSGRRSLNMEIPPINEKQDNTTAPTAHLERGP